jgi:hypothetical protein
MRWLIVGLLILAFSAPVRVAAQGETSIRIAAPASGGVLRGIVNITGTSAVDGFFASELAFTYASDPANSWFLIYSTDQPVSDGLLAAWDTALVTDGDYDLRLRVTLQDGTFLETLVTGLRIRNLAATETATPTLTFTPAPADPSTSQTDSPPTPMLATSVAFVPTSTSTPRPTPTLFPPNPASVTSAEIYSFLGRGILLSLLSFIVIAILLRLRRS